MRQQAQGPMNKGSIVERLCSDLDRKEPRYKSPILLLLYTGNYLVNTTCFARLTSIVRRAFTRRLQPVSLLRSIQARSAPNLFISLLGDSGSQATDDDRLHMKLKIIDLHCITKQRHQLYFQALLMSGCASVYLSPTRTFVACHIGCRSTLLLVVWLSGSALFSIYTQLLYVGPGQYLDG